MSGEYLRGIMADFLDFHIVVMPNAPNLFLFKTVYLNM